MLLKSRGEWEKLLVTLLLNVSPRKAIALLKLKDAELTENLQHHFGAVEFSVTESKQRE